MQKSIAAQFIIPPQSPSAIPIVAPSESSGNGETDSSSKASNKPSSKGKANTKRLCRNVIIHGFCKYEGKGCEFNHEVNKPSSQQGSPENKLKKSESTIKLRTQSSGSRSGTSSMVSSVSAESVNAPVFVPKSAAVSSATAVPASTSTAALQNGQGNGDVSEDQEVAYSQEYVNQTVNHEQGVAALTDSFSQFGLSSEGTSTMPTSPTQQTQTPSQMLLGMGMMQPGQMDTYGYYMGTPMFTRQPLQYHLYTSPTPDVSNLLPHQRTIKAFFIPDDLREMLTRRNEATLMSAPARELGLPKEVHVYHSLYPLDEQPNQPSKFFGHSSRIYKAISNVDGRYYVLVRIEGFRLTDESAMRVVECWRMIRHCNIVSVREAFTTRAFGDSSLVFVYDYHPCSKTLYQSHFTHEGQAALFAEQQAQSRAAQTIGPSTTLVPEITLWSYITQITSAIKNIHGCGLAARNIEPSKILVTGKNRLRLNYSATQDVIQYDGGQNIARHQQEDLLAFGKLIVALACNSLQSFHNLPQSFEHISRCYSPDLKNVVLYLLSKPLPTKTINEVITLCGPRILHAINCSQFYADTLESELSRELENGRLVRLLAKMGFINERPEFDMDPSWSETGDRYIIKLFRDYVFHQVDENGVPVVDMVHVLTCLNKLDAGVDEKIMLMSRDEQSCLIVSYKEVKNCIISAFKDLTSGRK